MDNILMLTNRYLSCCRNIRKLSPATVKAYTCDMQQFLEFLKEKYPDRTAVEQINKAVLWEYLATLNSCLEARSAKRKTATLRSFFHYLEMDEIIRDNPFRKIHFKRKEPFRLPDVMTLSDMQQILSAVYLRPRREIKNSPLVDPAFIRLRDIAVLELLFATGIRVQELCDLTYGDFDFGESTVKIRGKGNKERYIYIENTDVLAAMSRYLKGCAALPAKSAYIFINKFGQKLSPQAVRNLVEKYACIAGIAKRITPHTFRHTFASLLLEEGVDIKYIQEFLGHSSISTTQIYLHVSKAGARNILRSKHPRGRLVVSSCDNVKLCSEGEGNLKKAN